MPYADIEMHSGVREEAKGQRKIFLCKFFLSCHKICILLHNPNINEEEIWVWTASLHIKCRNLSRSCNLL